MRKVWVVGGDVNIERMFYKRNELYERATTIEHADILCFIGGADVNPVMYSEQKLPKTLIDVRADQRDINFWTLGKGKFKVGICRGSQFLNVKSGGAMWQHVNGHNCGNHEIIDLLFSKSTLEATSTHHQMMIPGPNGEVLAIAMEADTYISAKSDRERPDYDTEVVWYEDTKSLCFQPHPEYQHSPKELTDYFFDLIDFFYEDKE